ncbi:TonB-dependent receptor plug domain-containing protein [Gilvimarinus sp. F26214L]|uniref:TonB-dependent receptor plug domain-containing protein n=1 Tax=Gilvimarinus sp. DZF01 TaxID=3461371 RepID=UPI004045766B
MKLNPIYRGIMYCALAVPATAFAQSGSGGQILEEIVITGSLIRGTPEDAAMPVDTITADDLEKQGAPAPLDMLKSLSYMNGIVGESNNFTSGRGQAAHGTASINLRGFGAARTLVLLNGKRLATSDANRLPMNAIARVEVLKDGGAATYGSDAIGGVVNYITKDSQDGFEFTTDYRAIEDSDGDYNIGLSWGTSTDNSDFFASLNYYHRSELQVTDREDWALQPYARNPQGGWGSGANPGSTLFFVDPACEAFGGVRTQGGSTPDAYLLDENGAQCRTRYTDWYNLVDEQDSYQFFSSYDVTIGDETDLHLEALYAQTEVPHARSGASYTTANYVPGSLNPWGAAFNSYRGGSADSVPFYYVPANNPGLVALRNAHPEIDAAITGSPLAPFTGEGAFIQLNQWRPYFAGGNPAFGYDGAWTNYDRDQYRLSGELTGMLTDTIGYTSSLTYSKATSDRQEWDIRIDKLQQALLGQGGPTGDMWLNPFSTGIPTIPGVGENPYFDPTTDLDEQRIVAQWLMEQHTASSEDELVEFNFVADGEIPVELAGGPIGWAAGVQYRHETDVSDYADLSNQELHPCPIYDSTSCDEDLRGASPWTFLATYVPYDIDREVKAVFGEMMIPFTDDFTAQLALRYEDYGDIGGDSLDPNLRLRWQATDWLAFRASAGTTFRVAGQSSLRPVESTGFQSVEGNSTPVGVSGNPDLDPEQARNYNFGVMFSGLNHELTIDYWRYEIDDVLTSEPLTGIVEAIYSADDVAAACAAVSADFLSRFEFANDTCGDTIVGMHLKTINGGSITNDGIDIAGRYTWDEVGSGSLSLGGSATWINQYETDGLTIDGVQVEEAFDGVGQFNSGTTLFPLPEFRGNLFLDYAMDTQNIRWTMNYVDSYEDGRDIFEVYSDGQTIDSYVTHDLTYRVDVSDNVTVNAVLDNVFDEEPPFVRAEMNYDPVTHSPLTRTFKVGAKVRF